MNYGYAFEKSNMANNCFTRFCYVYKLHIQYVISMLFDIISLFTGVSFTDI